MNSRQKRLKKLLALARAAGSSHAPVPETLPHGFAARVVAQWVSRPPHGLLDSWLRACWWGVGGAAAICIVTAAYQMTLPERDGLELLVDAVVEAEPF